MKKSTRLTPSGFDAAELRDLADAAVAGFRAFLYTLAELAEKAYVESLQEPARDAGTKPPGRRQARGKATRPGGAHES